MTETITEAQRNAAQALFAMSQAERDAMASRIMPRLQSAQPELDDHFHDAMAYNLIMDIVDMFEGRNAATPNDQDQRPRAGHL